MRREQNTAFRRRTSDRYRRSDTSKNRTFYQRVVLAPQPRTLSPDRVSQRPFAPTGPGAPALQTFSDHDTISDGSHTAHRTMCRQGPRGVKATSEIVTPRWIAIVATAAQPWRGL
jgi:hypothetical protein